MNLYRNFLSSAFVCGTVALCACDLQPKIASIPDSVGDFISTRYPALLADPVNEPEIYNSAVTDYGVYASPELYGSGNIDDYVLYASVDDYVFVPNPEKVDEENQTFVVEHRVEETKEIESESSEDESDFDDYLSVPKYVQPTNITPAKEEVKNTGKTNRDFVIVARGDTLYSIARANNMTVPDLAKINLLNSPYTLKIGQKIKLKSDAPIVVAQSKAQKTVEQPVRTPAVKEQSVSAPKAIEPAKTIKNLEVKPNGTKRVVVQEITVAPGETLYSLSRKYETPVNDLAVMNKISSPFILSVGQKLKVPKLDSVEINSGTAIKQTKTEPKVKKTTGGQAKKDTIVKKSEKKQKTSMQQKQPDTPKTNAVKQNAQPTKISSDPNKQLPKIAARSSNKFSWPVRGKVLSQYGAKKGGLFNDGINISANLGTAVKAAENGVVAYAGNEVKGMGNLIIIQHSDGWMTVYGHLDSMSVRRGARVSVGQQIGKIGKTGKVDKPQLHFEIRRGTKAYNPISYLKK
jgi:murein DD-endopeptidase MepM/ murein hydrolase activator NlpD